MSSVSPGCTDDQSVTPRVSAMTSAGDPPARGGGAGGPAALVFERLRQVPVIEGRDRADAPGDEPVDEALVEPQPRLVRRAAASRLDAGPGDREPVRLEPELGHQVEVGVEPVIVVVGDVAGVAVPHLAWGVAEGVPDRRPPAVLLRSALDLVRGGRRAEEEVVGEGESRVAVISRAGGHRERSSRRMAVSAPPGTL